MCLVTDRRRRRKGQRRTRVCVFKESDALWDPRRRRSSRSIRVELHQELAYRSERRVTKTQDTKAWDTMWLVMAFTCANETSRFMLNRRQSMSTIRSSMTSRRLSATARSGSKRHRNAATPRGEKITRHGRVWRTFPSAVLHT